MLSTRPHLLLPVLALTVLSLGAAESQAKDELRGSYVWRQQPLAFEEEVPRILYLNRCADGCVITPGAEDAVANTSSIPSNTAMLAPFPHGDELWDEVVACIRNQYARFDINVTDQDPGDTPHFESIIAGDAADVGAFGAAGIAPFSCGVWPNSINYTFAETIGPDVRALCETAAQESGHAMGLEHALLCEDPMTYLSGCGPKEFQDVDAACGEFEERACDCGNATQNSVQYLLSVFGEGNQEATAHIEIAGVRESEGNSDGNAIAEPGETVRIDVKITNRGNQTSDEVGLRIKSDGRLKLLQPAEAIILEPGRSVELALEAEVTGKACGEDVAFTVKTELGGESWSDEAAITAGISESSWTSNIPMDAPWQVEEEGSAAQGNWGYGVPEETFFAGRKLQPDGASAGSGTPVWMTGLDGAWDEGVVVGESALVSSTIDLGHWHAATGIRYKLWYLALDRARGLAPAEEAHLFVELSKDGGKSWTLIDEVSGEDYRWEEREVGFEPLAVSSKTKLRFVVRNDGSTEELLLEAGIDEVTLLGGELLCTPEDGGCGCSSTGERDHGWILFLVFWALWASRRRFLAALGR